MKVFWKSLSCSLFWYFRPKAVYFRLSIPMAPFADGPEVGTKMASLAIHKMAKLQFFPQYTKLWDRRHRFQRFNVPTSEPSPTVPKIWRPNCGNVSKDLEVWDVKTFLKPCWYKMMTKITFYIIFLVFLLQAICMSHASELNKKSKWGSNITVLPVYLT